MMVVVRERQKDGPHAKGNHQKPRQLAYVFHLQVVPQLSRQGSGQQQGWQSTQTKGQHDST